MTGIITALGITAAQRAGIAFGTKLGCTVAGGLTGIAAQNVILKKAEKDLEKQAEEKAKKGEKITAEEVQKATNKARVKSAVARGCISGIAAAGSIGIDAIVDAKTGWGSSYSSASTSLDDAAISMSLSRFLD